MKTDFLTLGIIALVAMAAFSAGMSYVPGTAIHTSMTPANTIGISVIRADGTVEDVQIFNVIKNVSKNNTVLCYATGVNCTVAAYDYIALGNSTTPTDAVNTLAGEIADMDLARGQADDSHQENSNIANASISKQWTASGTTIVNTTGLFNASSGGTMLAGASFTTVTLNAGDKINVTWWIAVV